MKIVSRKKAMEMSLTRYCTGTPCKNGHVSERWTKSSTCVDCDREYQSSDEYKQYKAEYKRKNKERIRAVANARNKTEAVREYDRAYRKTERYKKKYREYRSARYLKDPGFRLRHSLKSRLRKYLKSGLTSVRASKTITMLGCSSRDLISHLEKQFRDGMSWDNYGTLWHIDHIVPLVTFDLHDQEAMKKATHYSNLQPLLWHENINKGDNEKWCITAYKLAYPHMYTH